MVSYFVQYRGRSEDPARFVARYAEMHAPILARLPAIRSLVLHTPVAWSDPFPVHAGGSMLLAQMIFESREALVDALRSDARKEARGDFSLFPAFEGEVTHEALAGRVVF